MKLILQYLIFTISIALFPQKKLSGKYCAVTISEFDSTCIEFKENSSFSYETFGCLGLVAYGNGSYKITNKTLKLQFEVKEYIQEDNVKVIESPSESEYEVEFSFNIKDENGFDQSIIGINVSDSTYFRLDEISRTIKVAKNDSSSSYKLGFPGYEVIVLKLDHRTNKTVDINLILEKPELISGVSLKYQLTDVGENGFTANNEGYILEFKKN